MDIFKEFLIRNNAYDSFVKNLSIQKEMTYDEYITWYKSKEHPFGSLVSVAFSWKRTNEGFSFWFDISHNWRVSFYIRAHESI